VGGGREGERERERGGGREREGLHTEDQRVSSVLGTFCRIVDWRLIVVKGKTVVRVGLIIRQPGPPRGIENMEEIVTHC
jgi:hypothetical protein